MPAKNQHSGDPNHETPPGPATLFVRTARRHPACFERTRTTWEGHKAGRDIGYCHCEKLHNLESVPADGYFISCFPHKIRGASAGWTRAVAIFDEALTASCP